MARLLSAFLFLSAIFVVTECQAQSHRGWFAKRGARFQNASRLTKAQVNTDFRQNKSKFLQTSRDDRYFDPRQSKYDRSGWEPYPKFIGGFHSSHFSNVGVPSGDIGFRGNGIYWTPW